MDQSQEIYTCILDFNILLGRSDTELMMDNVTGDLGINQGQG